MDLALAFEDAEPFKLTVEQYHEMMMAGVIDEAPRIELIEGMIVRKNAQGNSHVFTTFELAVRLRDALREMGASLTAVTTPAVSLPPHNALEPDVAVTIKPRMGPEFLSVSDVAILIEVSASSLRKDLRFKRDTYARAGVPEYWVVDTKAAEVHRFHQPQDGVYRAEPPVPLAGPLESLTIAGLAIDGSGIL